MDFAVGRGSGSVAYCPYCGREPSFATIDQEPDDRPQSDGAVASAQEASRMPAGELIGKRRGRHARSFRSADCRWWSKFGHASAAITGQRRLHRSRPYATRWRRFQSVKTVAASVTALLSRRCGGAQPFAPTGRPVDKRTTSTTASSCARHALRPQVSRPQTWPVHERRASASNSTAHRHRGPAPINTVAMLRGERGGRVVQIAGMSF